MRAGRPLTGIQRVTLNSLIGAWERLGSSGVKVIFYDKSAGRFLVCDVEQLLRPNCSDHQGSCNFQKADCVILSEYLWDTTVANATLQRKNFGPARLYRLVYDVIPLAMPKLSPWTWAYKFRRFISGCIENADCVITISDFSKSDIQKYFPRECQNKPIHVLKLPHEFIGVQTILELAGFGAKNLKTEHAERALVSEPFVLMVGSIDERKNQLGAIEAWQKLFLKHGNKLPKLVFVGGLSSHGYFFKAKIRRALKQTDKFIHLAECDDDGLRWLYQNCQFSIFISHYEGWGLPVGESLWFGKPVISARTTSLPEVGEDYADYVDADNEAELLAKIELMCFDQNYPIGRAERIDHQKLWTWEKFSEKMLNCINGGQF